VVFATIPFAYGEPARTVEDRLLEFGPAVRQRIEADFVKAGIAFPPPRMALVAFKDERALNVFGRENDQTSWRFVKRYRVRAASGTLGPKVVAGDRQVPEGIYRIDSLNPNSRYHLALRLNYPNDYDRTVARLDHRENLGGDIMIHGSRISDGCLAMGDEAAEDLFVLTALVGIRNVRVVISPTDFRDPTSHVPTFVQKWVQVLYLALRAELRQYPEPPPAQRSPPTA
jgi:hypothetical protein